MKKIQYIILIILIIALMVFATFMISKKTPDNKDINDGKQSSTSETAGKDENPTGKPDSYISFNSDSIVGYAGYTYEKLEKDIKTLEKYEGELVKVSEIGKSCDGRNIYALTFGNPNAEKKIVIQAGIHGREYGTTMLVMKEIEYYLNNRDTIILSDGKTFGESLENLCYLIVPSANPDGMVLASEGIEAIKSEELKNGIREIFKSDENRGLTDLGGGEKIEDINRYLHMWKANARGVDLNRNYNSLWETLETKIHTPSLKEYKGISPESEPETKAMVDFVNSESGIVAVVSLHSRGEVIYWDCNQTGKVREESLDIAVLVKQINGYTLIAEPRNDSSFTDWTILKKEIPSVTIEIGEGSGASKIYEEVFSDLFDENFKLLEKLSDKYVSGGKENG